MSVLLYSERDGTLFFSSCRGQTIANVFLSCLVVFFFLVLFFLFVCLYFRVIVVPEFQEILYSINQFSSSCIPVYP